MTNGKKTIRILMADDHGMIRQGLRAAISARPHWECCGEAEDGRAAVKLARRLRPDLVILDHTMPELNGLDVARQILAHLPATAVLFLTMHDSESLAREVLAIGARGYLLKSDAPEMLPAAIESLAAGLTYFSPQVSRHIPGADTAAKADEPPRSRLTPREREIIQLLAEGKSNKEAADTLGISTLTIETHRKNVMSKLGLRSTSDLVRYAIRNKLIEA